MDEQHGPPGEDADELLRRALIDPEASVAVALRVGGLALSDALTIVFHGRARPGHDPDLRRARPPRRGQRDRRRRAAARARATSTSATPARRDEAEEAYAEQARALRDALLAADTVLADLARAAAATLAEAQVGVDRSVDLQRRACPPTG